jgi:hypothetical protein
MEDTKTHLDNQYLVVMWELVVKMIQHCRNIGGSIVDDDKKERKKKRKMTRRNEERS